MQLTLLLAGTATSAWLLLVLHRADARKRLPWFVGYVCWVWVETTAQLVLWLLNPLLYFKAYWWMDAIEIALIVAAMRESFLHIFHGFTSKSGFRWAVVGVIVAVIAYSAWKAIYAPPVQGKWLSSFVFGAEFLFRWGIAGVGLLTIVLTWLLGTPPNTHEDAVVTGFTLYSGVFVAGIVVISLFGTKYLFFGNYLPPVGYFMAIFFWIWAFSHKEQGSGFEELGIGPEDMLKTMRSYRQAVKRIRGNQ